MHKILLLAAAMLTFTSCLPGIQNMTKAEFCVEKRVKDLMKIEKLDLSKFDSVKDVALEKCQKTFSTCSESMFGNIALILEHGGNISVKGIPDDEKCIQDSNIWVGEIKQLSHN